LDHLHTRHGPVSFVLNRLAKEESRRGEGEEKERRRAWGKKKKREGGRGSKGSKGRKRNGRRR